MALDFATVKDILLEELRAKGYAPNPGDLVAAVNRIVDASAEEAPVAGKKPPKP